MLKSHRKLLQHIAFLATKAIDSFIFTYTKGVTKGSLVAVSDRLSNCSKTCAKMPVRPVMAIVIKSKTFGTTSSETIVVHPLFSKSSAERNPASIMLYPYSPTYVKDQGLNRLANESTLFVMQDC